MSPSERLLLYAVAKAVAVLLRCVPCPKTHEQEEFDSAMDSEVSELEHAMRKF